MVIAEKPRPAPDPEFVFHPEHDREYVHFENASMHPFGPGDETLGRRRAWWLADAALLTYWEPAIALNRLAAAGLQGEFISHQETQAYFGWTDDFLIVAFRGTQPDEWEDVLDDAKFIQVEWNRPGTHVHSGFKDALDRVWPVMSPLIDDLSQSRTVWFAGHSLGAALATLAADRFARSAGVCTLGSPRVGDVAFANAFNARFGGKALRYVDNTDIVTHVPPPFPAPFLYKHVAGLRQIAASGTISNEAPRLAHFFPELIGDSCHVLETVQLLQEHKMQRAPKFLLDHMPRRYTVDIWNDYARHGD